MAKATGAKTDTISAFFEQDHREIDAILKSVDFGAGAKSVPRLEEFDRRLERHIVWEEDILFPAVGKKAPPLEMGPIRVMKFEHQEIRRHKTAALEALRKGDGAAAEGYIRSMVAVLGGHNMKEEQILYPACDEMLGPSETQAVLDRVRA